MHYSAYLVTLRAIYRWRALFILLEASTTSTRRRRTCLCWPHTGLARPSSSVRLWASCGPVESQPRGRSGQWSDTPWSRMGHFWPILWPFLVDNNSGMSGGRCPPFEDGRKNTGQRQSNDFRVPAAATANWLRTTYQIDNNAAGTYTTLIYLDRHDIT